MWAGIVPIGALLAGARLGRLLRLFEVLPQVYCGQDPPSADGLDPRGENGGLGDDLLPRCLDEQARGGIKRRAKKEQPEVACYTVNDRERQGSALDGEIRWLAFRASRGILATIRSARQELASGG